MREYAMQDREKVGRAIYREHCRTKKEQELAARHKLGELERQYGDEPEMAIERARARTKLAQASLLQ